MGPPPEAAEGSGLLGDAATPTGGQRKSRVTVEDVDEEDYEGELRDTEEDARRAALEEEEDRRVHEQQAGWEDEFDEQFWAELEAEVHQAAGYARECFSSLHALNALIEGMTSAATDAGLGADDLQTFRDFIWKMKHNVTDEAFRDLRYARPESFDMRSWKATQQHVGRMSELKPQVYDCCINSCLCYVGPNYAALRICPFCREARFDARGRARRKFTYIPLIPRLQAFLANSAQAERMRYRAEYEHDPHVIKDIYDGKLYRALLGKCVQPVQGPAQLHRYFEAATDVALGLSTDGYAPFRRRAKTAWPLLIFNYNLPPEIRFQLDNMICVGVIPGPKKPQDFDSFLWPLVDELLRLELGVDGFDAHAQRPVRLRTYLLLVFGDIPAVSMAMKMKGHNGICPCRFCKIRGVRVPGDTHSPHYVPLNREHHPAAQVRDGEERVFILLMLSQAGHSIPVYNARDLPKRTHDSFLAQAREVAFTDAVGAREKLAKHYGIKGISILSYLSTISFPHSFPYDFMHLIWENVVKNLFSLWFGDFKGLDAGTGSYQLDQDIINDIGAEGAAAGSSIPYTFGTAPPNIASDKVSWTADSRSFWTLHLAPVLLRDRLPDHYFVHFLELVKLLNICLEFDMDRTNIDVLHEGFASWVEDFERYVVIRVFVEIY
jgi:hypothetical protein